MSIFVKVKKKFTCEHIARCILKCNLKVPDFLWVVWREGRRGTFTTTSTDMAGLTFSVRITLSVLHLPFYFEAPLLTLPPETPLWIRCIYRPPSLSLLNRRSLRAWDSCRRAQKLVTRLHIHTPPHHSSMCTWTQSQHPHVRSPFVFSLFVFSPVISRYLYTDPLHCNMTYLLLRLLKDDLKEYAYAARLAGLVYGIASGMNAILVSKIVWSLGGWWSGCGGEGALPERLWQNVEAAWVFFGGGGDLHKSPLAVAAFAANTNSVCHCGEVQAFLWRGTVGWAQMFQIEVTVYSWNEVKKMSRCCLFVSR